MSTHPTEKTCSFPDCGREHYAKGYCQTHWEQQRKGKTLTPIRKMRSPGSPPVVECDEQPCPKPYLIGPCQIFRGRKNHNGYGTVPIKGRPVRVHRYVWEKANGPIPEGMMIDHLCQVRPCVNIQHLRCVTPRVSSTENVTGACWQLNRAKTHCPKGHEYTEANTYRNSKGDRICRSCMKIRDSGRLRCGKPKWTEAVCGACEGTGRFVSPHGASVPCPHCRGTGKPIT